MLPFGPVTVVTGANCDRVSTDGELVIVEEPFSVLELSVKLDLEVVPKYPDELEGDDEEVDMLSEVGWSREAEDPELIDVATLLEDVGDIPVASVLETPDMILVVVSVTPEDTMVMVVSSGVRLL